MERTNSIVFYTGGRELRDSGTLPAGFNAFTSTQQFNALWMREVWGNSHEPHMLYSKKTLQ
jgi:hypothetical protein